jgi:hypothetical protein
MHPQPLQAAQLSDLRREPLQVVARNLQPLKSTQVGYLRRDDLDGVARKREVLQRPGQIE